MNGWMGQPYKTSLGSLFNVALLWGNSFPSSPGLGKNNENKCVKERRRKIWSTHHRNIHRLSFFSLQLFWIGLHNWVRKRERWCCNIEMTRRISSIHIFVVVCLTSLVSLCVCVFSDPSNAKCIGTPRKKRSYGRQDPAGATSTVPFDTV